MSKIFLRGLILIVVLGCGLIFPGIMLRMNDRQLAQSEWKVKEIGSSYEYDGTLENRVFALTAYLSGSPTVEYSETGTAASGTNVWDELYEAGLLPMRADNNFNCLSVAFHLRPVSIKAEYEYYDVTYSSNENTLHAIVDASSDAILRMDFTCSAEKLQNWMKITGEGFETNDKYDELLTGYAKHNHLGTLDDLSGNYTDGAVMQIFEMNVTDGCLAVSLKYSPNYGLLMYSTYANTLA